MTMKKKELEFEDVLEEVGDYGKFQKILIWGFLFPAAFLLPWYVLNIIFLVYIPDHWCYVPEVAQSNLTLEAQRNIFLSHDDASCFMYDLNYKELVNSNNDYVRSNTKLVPCTSWQYDTTHFEETAASKWNLVCGNSHYASLAMTLTYVGSIIGTPIYGYLSDRIGRKPVFFIVVTVTAVTGITSVVVNNFVAFLVLRTINGSLMPSILQLPYIIAIEIVGMNKRTLVNGTANISWGIGLCFLSLVAYLTRHWVTLGIFTSSSCFLFFIYWKYIPESARFLISRERYGEALTVMTRIAETNGKTVDPADLLSKLKALGKRTKEQKLKSKHKDSGIDLLRFPNLRKNFLIVSFCWIANVFSYYGLQINVTNLGGDPFVNFFLLALVEIPSLFVCWYFMEKWGRRWGNVIFMGATALVCIFVGIVPDIPEVATICSLIGKFVATASFLVTYQQSSECNPTSLRAIGMGLSGTLGGVANIIIPYVIYLAYIEKYIPFLIIGGITFLASISAMFLPETLNYVLPQTVQDSEEFGRDQRLFACGSRRKSSVVLNDVELCPSLLTDARAEKV